MSRHQINGLCQRCFTAVVAVALDIAELVSDLRHIPAEQLIFAFAVSQVDEHIRIRVAQDDGFKIPVILVCIRKNDNSHSDLLEKISSFIIAQFHGDGNFF